MQARNNWVLVSLVTALMSGVVGYTAYQTYAPAKNTPGVTVVARPEIESSEWQSAVRSFTNVGTSTDAPRGPYRAPSGISSVDKISRELVAGYFEQARDGSFTLKDRNSLLKDTVARNAPRVEKHRVFTNADFIIDDKVPLDTYAANVVAVLKKAESVKSFELELFTQTINANNALGTPKLTEASNVYASIVSDLTTMRVPSTFAADHVALLNSVESLSETTKLMGNWGGDPILAVAYIDAFVKADRDTSVAVGRFFYTVKKTLAKL